MRLQAGIMCICAAGIATVLAFAMTNDGRETSYSLSDEALTVKVTLKCRRMPLLHVIQRLNEFTPARLRVASEVKRMNRRVSLGVKDMPLYKVMQALADLYQLVWERDGDTYTLSLPPGPWHKPVLREIGSLPASRWGFLRFTRYWVERHIVDRARKLLQRLPAKSKKQLREGIPIRELPPETRLELLRIRREARFARFVELLRRAYPDEVLNGYLIVNKSRKPPVGEEIVLFWSHAPAVYVTRINVPILQRKARQRVIAQPRLKR